MLGLSLGLSLGTSTNTSNSGGGVEPNRYMFFASRTRMPSGFTMPAASGLNYFASKLKFGNAPYMTRGFRFHFSGFALNEGLGPQETILPGNNVVIDGVDLVIGGVAYPAVFSGSAGVTIASGAKGAWCDFPTAPDLPAEADFIVITRWHVNAGQNFIGPYRIQKHRGEKFWAAADPSALGALIGADAPVTPSLDVFYAIAPGNQTNSQQICYGPDMMLAKGEWDGRPVALSTGDSIGYGRQEVSASADIRGNFGWESKWLDADADDSLGRIPHMIIGCPSAQSVRELMTSAFLRWDILDDIKAFNGGKYPFTVVLNQMGTNDNNTTTSTWKARMTGLISRIKARLGSDMKVIQCTIPPQNSSSTAFATSAGITVNTAIWVTGRNSLNADIRNNNGFGHDGYIDVDQAWTDHPANPDKFRSATDLGQIGTMLSYTPGDGASVLSSGVLGGFVPRVGNVILVEYQPATYATRIINAVVDNGNDTYNVGFTLNAVTAFQANAATYWAVSPEGVHPQPGYIDTWIVPRLPQSEKAKLSA